MGALLSRGNFRCGHWAHLGTGTSARWPTDEGCDVEDVEVATSCNELLHFPRMPTLPT